MNKFFSQNYNLLVNQVFKFKVSGKVIVMLPLLVRAVCITVSGGSPHNPLSGPTILLATKLCSGEVLCINVEFDP